jgi:hypothetical protein
MHYADELKKLSAQKNQSKFDMKDDDFKITYEKEKALHTKMNKYLNQMKSVYPQLPILESLLSLDLQLKEVKYYDNDKKLVLGTKAILLNPTDLLIRPAPFFSIIFQYKKLIKKSADFLQQPIDPFLRNAIIADLIAFGKILQEIYHTIDLEKQYQYRVIFSKEKYKSNNQHDLISLMDIPKDRQDANETFKLFSILTGENPHINKKNSLEMSLRKIYDLYTKSGVFYEPSFISSFKLEQLQVDPKSEPTSNAPIKRKSFTG